jgi:hypothetical protein
LERVGGEVAGDRGAKVGASLVGLDRLLASPGEDQGRHPRRQCNGSRCWRRR